MPYTRLYNYPTPYDRTRTGTLITSGEVSLTILCAVKFSRFRYKDALNTFINMSAASRQQYANIQNVPKSPSIKTNIFISIIPRLSGETHYRKASELAAFSFRIWQCEKNGTEDTPVRQKFQIPVRNALRAARFMRQQLIYIPISIRITVQYCVDQIIIPTFNIMNISTGILTVIIIPAIIIITHNHKNLICQTSISEATISLVSIF